LVNCVFSFFFLFEVFFLCDAIVRSCCTQTVAAIMSRETHSPQFVAMFVAMLRAAAAQLIPSGKDVPRTQSRRPRR